MPTVRRCCIIGCVSNSREKPQLQFFQFPKPEHPFHKLWMQACQASLNRILPFKKPVVCALHFHPKNIGGRRLTGNAIPCMQLDVPLNLRALEQQNMAQEIERSRKYVFLNAVVYEWLVRSNLNPNIRGSVTHGMIKEKAEIAKNIIGLDGFVADNRWLNTFRETQLKGFAAKLAGNQLEPQGGSSLAIPDIIKDLEHLYPPANAEHMENVPEQYLNYIQQYGEYDEDEDDEKDRNHMQQTTSLHHFTNGNHLSANSQINQDYSYNNIYNNNNNNNNNANNTTQSLYGYNNYNNNNNSNNNSINAIYNNYNQNNSNNNIYYNQPNGGNYINYQQQQHHHQQHQQQQSQQQPNTYFNALTQKYTVTSTGFEGHSDSNYSSPQYSNTSQSPPVQTQLPQQPPTNKRQKLDIMPVTKTIPTTASTTPITTKEPQAQPQQICETVYIEDDDVEFVAETKLSESCGLPSPKPQNMAASDPKCKVVEGKSSASPKSVSLSPQPNQQKLNAVLRVRSALQENNNFSTSTLPSEVHEKEGANEICKVKKVNAMPNMKSLESYEEALAYLKPLEDFVLMKENFRAIGLLSQFEVILRRGVSATSSGRAKVAVEEP